MAKRKKFSDLNGELPDEFVLAGGRIGNKKYPDALHRRIPGGCPERQCYIGIPMVKRKTICPRFLKRRE